MSWELAVRGTGDPARQDEPFRQDSLDQVPKLLPQLTFLNIELSRTLCMSSIW